MIYLILFLVSNLSAGYITQSDYDSFVNNGKSYTIYLKQEICPGSCIDLKGNPPAYVDVVDGVAKFSQSKKDAVDSRERSDQTEKVNKELKLKKAKIAIRNCINNIDSATTFTETRPCIKILLKHAIRKDLTSSEL